MTHLGLFEGIGGFSLAARWMGWETLAWCEWNEFGQKVLKYHFPEAEGFGDITKIDFTKYANRIDVLTGGFPCQPFSVAGKRKGTEDDRYLWGEMLRAIREVQPRYIVAENVRGLVNWNGGMVFEQVQTDLETQGYEVTSFLLPACAKDATHRRDRVWFIGHSKSKRGQEGLPRRTKTEQPTYRNSHKDFIELGGFRPTIASSFFGSGNDGLSERLDGITFPKWRNESIKAYGNAIVPQVAYEIFKAIEKIELI